MEFSIEPSEAKKKVQSLFSYEIPGGDQGYMTMTLFGFEMSQVTSTTDPPNVLLTVSQIPQEIEKSQHQQLQEQYHQTIADQVGTTYTFTTARQMDSTLCEQPVTIIIQEGTVNAPEFADPQPAITYSTILDNYQGSDRYVSIFAHGQQPEQLAQTVYNSLDCK
ncbi:MAG: hypothetical protein F6K03_09210 [Kamptonema sp. SIO4C4]|nr:hypothetical protein [Kamptonema sp. SIO4C4]